ncbi:MAG: endonuclease/exonuclease/phosphatase family protein [Chloroflexota bacterium]|nr:endonuclease/exonuclease/phosphatase family protein [Chloroflexota bacterium]
MIQTETSFSLLTFNCFGGLNWTTPRRLLALARELAQYEPTVACFQEVETHAARRLLLRACTSHPEQVFIPGRRAPLGSLLTLAQTPLGTPQFVRYLNQGAWYSPTLMDRLTQKGALITQLQVGDVPVVMINTHLVANYGANWRPDSRAARDQQSQLRQLASLVRDQPPTALVLVAGDFNIPRGGWLYDEFLMLSGLHDPLAGDERPTYRPFPGVPARYALPIDFVFVRPPAHLPIQTEATLCFGERVALVGGGQSYLSDHLGVLVTLKIRETGYGIRDTGD